MKSRLAALALVLMSAMPLLAQSTGMKASLESLKFMAGHWQETGPDGVSDEHWAEPLGNSMIGMFRQVKDDKVVFYELLSIENVNGVPVLKLKHFNEGLIGWEEKDKVWNYTLVKLFEEEAVFERADRQTRLVYKRTGPDTMIATLIRTKEGKSVTDVFQYKRVPSHGH